MEEAERIAREEHGSDKILVISGVVRKPNILFKVF
jgi:histone acetyltransferase (RNA polymerase elongator complex component)